MEFLLGEGPVSKVWLVLQNMNMQQGNSVISLFQNILRK
jgi:hypothetical protein